MTERRHLTPEEQAAMRKALRAASTPLPARCEPPPHLREKDGWHWIAQRNGGQIVAYWTTALRLGIEPYWERKGYGSATPAWAASNWGWTYIAPVPSPEQLAALVSAARAVVANAGSYGHDDAIITRSMLNRMDAALAPFEVPQPATEWRAELVEEAHRKAEIAEREENGL